MPAIFDYRHTVLPDEIDALGHANNLVYLGWMQAAALAHSAAQGWPTQRYFALGSGWVVRSHQIEYLRPALVDDELIVRTWVADFRRVTSLRKYQIWRARDQKQLALAETNWAFVRYQTGLPTRVPPEIQDCFELVTDVPAIRDRAAPSG